MLTFSSLGRYGRFANQLFQIAGTIGIATQHGYAYGFPEWKNYDHAERFGSSEDIDLQKYFLNPLPTIDNASDFPDRPIPWGWHENLNVPDNFSLSGHMQSEKYFAHCKDIIQHYFTMKDEPEVSEDVAIHIRRGDYDDLYHNRLKRDYYYRALDQFSPQSKFVVFTDDRDAAREVLGKIGFDGKGIAFFSEGKDYIEDFRMMKSCKHFITGNSSYSLMAAILGRHPDKKIICPYQWFGQAWNPETKDLYPQNAIII